jgi:hypothetical protein
MLSTLPLKGLNGVLGNVILGNATFSYKCQPIFTGDLPIPKSGKPCRTGYLPLPKAGNLAARVICSFPKPGNHAALVICHFQKLGNHAEHKNSQKYMSFHHQTTENSNEDTTKS